MGLGGTDLNAISVFASGAMLFSINSTTYTIPNLIGGPNGGETITENDVVMFLPTSTGTNTAGQMWFIVDGDDIGLDSSAEDISGLWVNIFGNCCFHSLRDFPRSTEPFLASNFFRASVTNGNSSFSNR